MADTVVVIFVEGDTDHEFYKKLANHVHKQRGGMLHCKIRYRNLRGIGNYKKDAASFLEKKIIPEYPGYKYKIALCYDTDVFERPGHVPVDWQAVEKKLRAAGADRIFHIRARQSIEDWFLCDIEGIRRFLRIPKKTNITSCSGVDGLKKLFKNNGRIYEKGKKCEGLIDILSMDVILPCIQEDIGALICLLR